MDQINANIYLTVHDDVTSSCRLSITTNVHDNRYDILNANKQKHIYYNNRYVVKL